jgi:peptidoglycan hydrolase-like protein with peptidoglycan-binding domain
MKSRLLLTAIASAMLLSTPALAAPAPAPMTHAAPAHASQSEARLVRIRAEYRRAQHKLKELGMYRGPVNGRRNVAFVKAVENFQRSHHIAASGRLTRETMRELFA